MSTTLNNQLWASADILRGKMDASEYKNYLLGLIFYKYLSDVELREVYEQENGQTTEFPEREEQFKILKDWYDEDKDDLEEIMRLQRGYFIAPEQLFFIIFAKRQMLMSLDWSTCNQALTTWSGKGTSSVTSLRILI